MKPLLLLVCYLLFISNSLVSGQSAAGCNINGISDNLLVLRIDDTQVNSNLASRDYEGDLEVKTCTGNDQSYFNVYSDDSYFLVDSTSEFEKLDLNTPKQDSPTTLLTLNCTLQCTSETFLLIQFQVEDTNNHDPVFTKTTYDFKIPSPVMPRTDFSIYGDSVIATDIDFSNQHVTFTITPDDFTITTLGTDTSKEYTAIFSTKNIIQLTEARTYTITASDSGTPTRTSTATINISADEDLSLDTPSFEQLSFSFNYSVVDGKPSLTPGEGEGDIIVTTIKPSAITSVSLDGEFSEHFKATFDSTTRTVKLEVVNLLPTSEETFTILTMGISTDNSASTSIIVYLPGINNQAPQFDSLYYTGKYNDDTVTVELDQQIVINSETTPKVSLSGDFMDHFDIVYDEKTTSYLITVKTGLTSTELKGLSYITLEITASVGESSANAPLILSLPEHVLEFTEVLYAASYKSDSTIALVKVIAFTTDVAEVSVSLGGTYADYFQVKPSDTKSQYVVVVAKSLPDKILKEEKEIILTLTASDSYGNIAHAALSIQLPEITSSSLSFSKILYTASYTTDGVQLDDDIVINNVEDQSLISIELGSYKDYFDVSYTDKWGVTVKKELEGEILSKLEIDIILTASLKDDDSTDQAVLVLTWKEAPKFSEEYYTGVYPENGKGNIKLDTDIGFSNIENPDKVVVKPTSYDSNFEVTYTDKWIITVTKPLDKSDLTKSELIITLSATENGNPVEGHSVLVIQLPNKEETLQFDKVYYVGQYPESGSGTIELEEPIKILNVDDQTTVDVTLDNYAENFEIKYELGKWSINIKNKLSDNILHGDPEIVMTLVATESANVENTAKSALVLQLPVASNDVAPIFSDAYYVAQYVDDGTAIIQFENAVKFTNIDDPSTVTIKLDKYSENLEVLYDKDRWYIHIISGLEDTVIEKNSELLITLKATTPEYSNEGYSALVLKLSGFNETSTVPEFSKAYYLASYPEEEADSIEFDSPVEILNVNDESSVHISLDNYMDNFEVLYDSKRWYIHVKSRLGDDILRKESELVMMLTAKEPGKDDVGYATLVLKLPDVTAETGLEFSEAYYLADYPDTDSTKIEFENPITFTSSIDPLSININLDSYTDNFKIKYDTDKWYIEILTKLNDQVLNSNTELVMTLTATETDDTSKVGHSALVLRLPTSNDASAAPEFSAAYYLVKYPTDDSDTIELPVSFKNVDSDSVDIDLDKYSENFELVFENKKWHINIKSNLDKSVLDENTELVITLTASESDKPNKGYSALVIELPATAFDESLQFEKAYYIAKYEENGGTTIKLENDIKILNIKDPTKIKINLDLYGEYFKITYTSNKWVLNLIKELDDTIINKNQELVMTMTATDNENEAYAALVVELPETEMEQGPIFSDAYYLADYPKEYTGIIELESPITFENVDIGKVTIKLSNYTDYFDLQLDNGRWFIKVKQNLDDTLLNDASELVATLIATTSDMTKEGYATLVLRLPDDTEVAPIFSETYYIATYTASGGDANVAFTDPIAITNAEDFSTVSISVDNYKENFNVDYDNESKSWVMKVIKPLDDDILLEKTDLMVALSATNSDNDLSGHASVDLSLPRINSNDAPQFSKTYYTARYSVSGETATVTFDTPLKINNKDDLDTITIGTDNYLNNFKIVYNHATDSWEMTVVHNLDQYVLNAKYDIVMALTATEEKNDEVGKSALVMRLPVVNNGDAPKFSSIYYYGTYKTDGGKATVELENDIEIRNKDLNSVTVSLDDSYRDNFEITNNDGKLVLNIKSPLDEDIFKNNPDLILTLTAAEKDNSNIGQAALILHLPTEETKLAPKFNLAHYSANYVIENHKANIILNDAINVVNKDNLDDINIVLDLYDKNFGIKFDSTNKQWDITIINPLLEEVVNSTRELILTLTATEANNGNTGEATLIITLPSSVSDDETVSFSQVHYSANYNSEEKGSLTLEDEIKVTTEGTSKVAAVSIESEEYGKYFSVDLKESTYVVTVSEPLPSDILETERSIVLTLVATVDTATSYATLVIDLPTTSTNISTISFSDALYTASYEIVNGNGQLTSDDTITVNTEEVDANVEISVSNSDGYDIYFQSTYSNKILTVSLSEENSVPTNVLRNNAIIPLVLTVRIKGTDAEASSVLNIDINYTEEEINIAFTNVLYEGQYDATDETPVLSVGEIAIQTSESDDANIVVTITPEDYSKYFSAKYTSGKVTVTLTDTPLTSDVLSHSVIPLILQAEIKETDYSSSAVLNIEIMSNTENDTDSISFSSVLYSGEYSVDVDDKRQLEISDVIEVTTTRPGGDIEVKVSDDYAKYFSVKYASGKVEISLTETPLTSDILAHSVIPLILQAEIKGTEYSSSAVLNIEIKNNAENDADSISFSSILYNGEYSVVDDNGKLEINGTIEVTTTRPDDDIEVTFSDDYKDYFNIEYASNKVTIDIKKNLTSEILQRNFIALTLIAGIKNTAITSSAVLNININSEHEEGRSISFANILYTGKYEVVDGTGALTYDTISIDTEEPDANIEVSITNEYESYFSVAYSSNAVKVTKDNELPETILNSTSVVPLALQASIKGTSLQSSAVVNIEIIYDSEEDTDFIEFVSVLYSGKYSISDGKGKLDLDQYIKIVTSSQDDLINARISDDSEYRDVFDVSYSNNAVDVVLKKNLPDDVIQANNFIALTLIVEIQDTVHRSSAVLNINIDNGHNNEHRFITFSDILYNGIYEVDDNTLTYDTVSVNTNEEDVSNIDIIISNEYESFFSAKYSENTVKIDIKEALTPEIINSHPVIPLTLFAEIEGTTVNASAVLNIEIKNIEEERFIAFSDILYSGIYEVIDDTVTLSTDTISVNTNENNNNVDITITNEFESFFAVKYSDKIVELNVKQALTSEILNRYSVIPLTLFAEIKGTTVNTSAVLNLELKYDSDGNDTIDMVEFASVLHTAEYTVNEGNGVLTVHDSIRVITNRPEGEVVADIADSDLKQYFAVSYSDKTVSVELTKNLTSDIINGRAFIALKLTIGIKSTAHLSSAVLNIEIIDNEEHSFIAFSDILYSGVYEVSNDIVTLSSDKISVNTNEKDNNVNIIITNEYESFFSVEYSDNTAKIDMKKYLTAEILDSYSVIPLTLFAEITGSSINTSAVLNLDIKYDSGDDNNTNNLIQFASILHNAEYLVDDGKGILILDDSIRVVTNRPDSDIEVYISHDSYLIEYFTVAYSDKIVSIDLVQNLPSDAIKGHSFIALTLTVRIKDTPSYYSSAVLNIEISGDNNDNDNDDDDDENKTELHHLRITFIVVTAILSVLLFACIAGAVAFYFLRMRGESYSNLEEEGSGRVRFGKNSLTRSPSSNKSSALEERRPTGFVFHPISEDGIDNPDAPNDGGKDRRKSVAFDDNVEKMQIEKVDDDDTDIYSSDKSQVTHV